MSDAEVFDALYEAAYDDVLRFVVRRVGPVDAVARAEDVTHETFLIAWRRLDAVPSDPGDAKAWLYTIARNCLLHEQRGIARRSALTVRLAASVAEVIPPPDDGIVNRIDLAAAWATLSPIDQEVLAIARWENLNSDQAGRVLGISAAAYRKRVDRARGRLAKALAVGGSLSAGGFETAPDGAPQPPTKSAQQPRIVRAPQSSTDRAPQPPIDRAPQSSSLPQSHLTKPQQLVLETP